jgi:hypothetical protein
MSRYVWVLARGAMPALTIATLIPVGLFYAALAAGSVRTAIVVSVIYAYGVATYQWRCRRRVSGMLLVTVCMATLRLAMWTLSGQAKLYFAIPVAETAGFGLMFLATMFTSEPLVVRLARDLVPGAADGIAARRSLIKALSLVWTITYVGSGLTTLLLLNTVPLRVFIATHVVSGWMWTGSGVLASIVICRLMGTGVLASLLALSPPGPGRPAAAVGCGSGGCSTAAVG